MFDFIKKLFSNSEQKQSSNLSFPNLKEAYEWAYSINSSKEMKDIINSCIEYTGKGFSSSESISKTIKPLNLSQKHNKDLIDFLSTFFLHAYGIMPKISISMESNNDIKQSSISDKILQKDTSTLFPSESKEWRSSTLSEYKEDGAIGVKWTLSSIHRNIDICSLYAKADFWGWGQGVYPLSKVPEIPHPSCHCCFDQIFDFDIIESLQKNPQFNPRGADKYLNSLSIKNQKAILGTEAWIKFNNRENYISELWLSYGILRHKTHNKNYPNELIGLFNTVSAKLKKVSVGARYHFTDIVEYSTYGDKAREATDMTLYPTRQKRINFEKTTQELLSVGLIKPVYNPLAVLSKFKKDELFAMANDRNKIPKKTLKKEALIQFICENYPSYVKKLTDKSNMVVLPDDLKQSNYELLDFLKNLQG